MGMRISNSPMHAGYTIIPKRMIRLLKHIMRIFFENENYSKYGPGNNYFMALIGTAFYILMTVAMFFLLRQRSFRNSIGIHWVFISAHLPRSGR